MPLPKGYVLDQPQPSAPKLPKGYTLDQPQQAAQPAPQTTTPPITDTMSAPPTFGEKLKSMVLHPLNAMESASQPISRPANATPGEMLGTDLHNVGAGMTSVFRHPIDTVMGMVKAPIQAVTDPKAAFHALNQGGPVAGAMMLGQGLATAGLGRGVKVAAPASARAMQTAGEGLQDAGGGVMNRTVGSLKADFRHGANPGRAYLDAGGGPALSMQSLADKGTALGDTVGGKLQTLYSNATEQGNRIPARTVAQAIQSPIARARSVIAGPGGTGNLQPIEEFGASFRPPLQKAVTEGGFTPNDLWAVKKNVAQNTSWGDPTQIGMKSLRQETTGALSGVLSDNVPGVKPLNAQYQGLSNFADRAASRALTRSSPLTSLMTKTALGTGGAALGMAHSPVTAALTGAGALALDSIPVKTTVGSGLYYGGKGLTAMGKGIQGMFAPQSGPATFAGLDQPKPLQLESNVPGNSQYGADYSSGSIPARSPITPAAPPNLPALPASVTSGPVQPMVGVKAPTYPPLAEDFARTRIKPTRFSGPPTNPFGLPRGYLQPPAPKVPKVKK